MAGNYTRDNDNIGQNLLHMTNQFVRGWEQLDSYLDDKQVQAAQGKLLQKARERGGDLSGLSFDDIENIYDMRALGVLQQQNSQNEQYRLRGMKNREAADIELYNQKILPTLSLMQQAYQSGDANAFDNMTQQLSNLLATPYRYKAAADGQGFDEYFRSDDALGFTQTGRKLSRDDIYNMVRNTIAGTQYAVAGVSGQRIAVNPQVLAFLERQRQATARGNEEMALNPKPMIGPGGKLYYAAAQNRLDDYNTGGDIVLFGANGNKVGVFKANDLGQRGYRWATAQDARRGRGRGGGQAAGQRQGGAPVKLTDADRKILFNYATEVDPESGAEVIDWGRAAFMEQFVQATGLSPVSAIHAYDQSLQNAMASGKSQQQAEIEVRQGLIQKLTGASATPQPRPGPALAPAHTPAQDTMPPAGVAAGVGGGVSPKTRERILNAVNR